MRVKVYPTITSPANQYSCRIIIDWSDFNDIPSDRYDFECGEEE